MTIPSFQKSFYGEPHLGHTYLLDIGIDSLTWKMYLSEREVSLATRLSDYVLGLSTIYHIYGSNELHSDSTYYTYTIVDTKHSRPKK